LGYAYDYNKYQEGHTGRVEFADSLYDATLDRAWTYDQVGRLMLAYTGTEANSDWESTPTGPYARGYNYDQFGNLTSRYGWGGAGRDTNSNYSATFTTKNQRTGHTYDLAGNVTNDGGQSFTYDATGQQAWASAGNLSQFYDGDGLRLKKVENGVTTYYLRSTVLGQQVAAEINSSGTWTRGYVYLGGTLLAIQDVPNNRVLWTHQEPFAKSQRITDSSGAIIAGVELEPFGLETNRSFDNSAVNQRRQFTTYDRDANGSDEAMFRRYNRWNDRFDQPDPSDGSYDFGDPQSFNRYAYTQGDPVNFMDPKGLQMSPFCGAEYSFSGCGGGGGFWGGNFGGHLGWFNRYYGGLSPQIAAALIDHDRAVQNTLDASRANAALQRALRTNSARDWKRFGTLMSANPTLAVAAALPQQIEDQLQYLAAISPDLALQLRFEIVTRLTGLADYIEDYSYDPATRSFTVSFKDGVEDFLADSPYFAGPGFAIEHLDVGSVDYRAYTGLTGSLSMQIVLSGAGPGGVRFGYIDFDRYNPYQDVVSFFKHLFREVLR
jgi:RHS repeat-associated protein